MNSQIAASARWKANSSIAASTARPCLADGRAASLAVARGPPAGGPRRRAGVHDQRGRARDQVAEVVGQIGVEPLDERLLGEVGVEAERHLAQDEVAEGVVAVLVGERERLDDVAERLRHLAAAERPVAVDVEAAGRAAMPGRLQHARPVDRVRLQDVLADQVLDVRPELREARVARAAERRDVVDQRVEPDVGDVLVVERQRDAPLRAASAGRLIDRSWSGSRRKPRTSLR